MVGLVGLVGCLAFLVDLHPCEDSVLVDPYAQPSCSCKVLVDSVHLPVQRTEIDHAKVILHQVGPAGFEPALCEDESVIPSCLNEIVAHSEAAADDMISCRSEVDDVLHVQQGPSFLKRNSTLLLLLAFLIPRMHTIVLPTFVHYQIECHFPLFIFTTPAGATLRRVVLAAELDLIPHW